MHTKPMTFKGSPVVDLTWGGDSDLQAFNSVLSSYWTMDESSGNRLDEVGSNTLTDINTVLGVSAKRNNGSDFVSSSSECLRTSTNPFGPTNNFVISCWMSSDSFAAFQQVAAQFETTTNNARCQIFVDTGGRMGANIQSDEGGSFSIDKLSLTGGQLYHTITIKDGTAWGFYVDGVLEGSATLTGTYGGSLQEFTVGCRRQASTDSLFLDGIVDELATWDSISFGGGNPTKATFVSKLYNSGTGRFYPA